MAHEKNHDYHIINPSIWPLAGAVGAFIMLFGAVLWFHGGSPIMAAIGLLIVIYVMYAWWAEVIDESHAGERGDGHRPDDHRGLRPSRSRGTLPRRHDMPGAEEHGVDHERPRPWLQPQQCSQQHGAEEHLLEHRGADRDPDQRGVPALRRPGVAERGRAGRALAVLRRGRPHPAARRHRGRRRGRGASPL